MKARRLRRPSPNDVKWRIFGENLSFFGPRVCRDFAMNVRSESRGQGRYGTPPKGSYQINDLRAPTSDRSHSGRLPEARHVVNIRRQNGPSGGRKVRIRVLVLVVGSLIATQAVAMAEDDVDACSKLLDHGITNVTSYSSQYEYLAIARDKFCSSSWNSMSSSKQAEFNIVVKKIPLGFRGGSDKTSDQHSEFCKLSESLQAGAGRTTFDAAIIYEKAVDAWRGCLEILTGGTVVIPTIAAGEKIVDFTLGSTKGDGQFNGVDATNMTCVLDGKPVGAAETIPLTAARKSLRCTRSFEKIEFQGGKVNIYPAADVKVKTSVGDYRVDLYEMVDEPAKTRLARLEAQVATLQALTTELKATVDTLGQAHNEDSPEKISGSSKSKMLCEPGSFVSGIGGAGMSGGKYASTSITKLSVFCSPLTQKVTD